MTYVLQNSEIRVDYRFISNIHGVQNVDGKLFDEMLRKVSTLFEKIGYAYYEPMFSRWRHDIA